LDSTSNTFCSFSIFSTKLGGYVPTTVNKGFTVPTTSSEVGTWGTDLNANLQGILDNNLGSVTTLSLSSSPVTLTTTQSQSAIVRLTGTLLGNVTITTACIGFTFVENYTSGNFSVTFTNGVSGVVIPQGQGTTVLTDASNGARIVSSSGGFATGTAIAAFAQATAPVGWTKSTSLDDYALRLVSGTGGITAGAVSFSSAFTNLTITKANLPNYNLTVTDPGHTHSYTTPNTTGRSGGGTATADAVTTTNTTNSNTTGISVNSGGSGTAISQFSVKNVSVINCTKD
jgi:hypothetical protein